MTTLGALFTALASFLLYFEARVDGRLEPWDRDVNLNLLCQHLHLVLFWVIPLMGSAYRYYNSADEAISRHCKEILCISAGVFLVVSAVVGLIAVDPPDGPQPRLSPRSRFLVRACSGIVVFCLAFVSIRRHSSVVVPLVMILVSHVELWGVQKRASISPTISTQNDPSIRCHKSLL